MNVILQQHLHLIDETILFTIYALLKVATPKVIIVIKALEKRPQEMSSCKRCPRGKLNAVKVASLLTRFTFV